jgi:predicted RNase H-like HicB family nuclease
MAHFIVYLQPAEEGGYIASVPALPGCATQGETREEALQMAQDAIRGYIESLKKHGEPLPFGLEKAEVQTVIVDVA